ncbi:VOC family protein [Flavobacterium sp. PLA-1-15]|uniref:VOC family protein n=1 Tax=Flavobacterium sp. PLA-1-15 TaxID=3380533 RepID=UPI003B79E376
MKHLHHIQTILYVNDQQASAAFYERLFRKAPDLNVPGMTEFVLAPNVKLGLMPNKGIAKLLGDASPHPDTGDGIPRCELYFLIEDLEAVFENAVAIGAKVISPILDRDWGDRACYFADSDGHVIALQKSCSFF